VDLPPPAIVPHPGPAAAFLIETIRARPERIALVAPGPLTDLAVAVRLDPRIVREAREVAIVGGAAFVGGNVSPVAEANGYNDPEAVAIVLEAGWPVTVIGLDVTTQVVPPFRTESFPVRIAREGPATGQLIVDRLQRFDEGPLIPIATAVDAKEVLALLVECPFSPATTHGS
jgi:purine nucleosidase